MVRCRSSSTSDRRRRFSATKVRRSARSCTTASPTRAPEAMTLANGPTARSAAVSRKLVWLPGAESWAARRKSCPRTSRIRSQRVRASVTGQRGGRRPGSVFEMAFDLSGSTPYAINRCPRGPFRSPRPPTTMGLRQVQPVARSRYAVSDRAPGEASLRRRARSLCP